MSSSDAVLRILDLARWAPSGDNTQPWTFEIVDPLTLVVHGFDTRDHCVYDLDGHPSQISMGALLETISIAASANGMSVTARRDEKSSDRLPIFKLNFEPSPSTTPSPLADVIEKRSVQRRPFSTRALTAAEKKALIDSVGPSFQISWVEGFWQRLEAAKLMFHSAKLRLTIPEAYRVHRDVIEWHVQFSKDRLPDQALGASTATLLMMRHVMKSWERVRFFNKYLAGTLAPRIEMDFVPGLACAAHFVISAKQAPASLDDYVAAGRAVQRFWLTATLLGLQLQPEITPLIFSRYARNKLAFSEVPGTQRQAEKVASNLGKLVGTDIASRAVFMGRVGQGKDAKSRSRRKDLNDLMFAERSRT